MSTEPNTNRQADPMRTNDSTSAPCSVCGRDVPLQPDGRCYSCVVDPEWYERSTRLDRVTSASPQEGHRRLWYTTAFDQRRRKWLTIEHVEQVVGEFDTRAEAEADGEGRLP